MYNIILGKPYLFTKEYYDDCIDRGAPVAVIYYDTKTSAASKKLYSSVLGSKDGVKALERKMSSYKIQNPDQDKYKGGYCCFMVYDRCGNIQDPDSTATGLLKSGSFRFPVLALSYNGKTYCHTLPDAASADELAEAIYGKCESGEGGIGKFSAWSGRTEWLEHQLRKPDSEIKPDKTGKGNLSADITQIDFPAYWEDPTQQKTYEGYDPGWTGDFSGIPAINNRPGAGWALNLADISTPETTYLLVGSYDMNFPENCPWEITSIFPKHMTNCDQYTLLKNQECINGNYTKYFTQGLKYRFFVFYEFSHGNSKVITIDPGKFTYSKIWDSFKNLNPSQRVWGIFDSCHSGSMIKNDAVPLSSKSPPMRADGSTAPSETENMPILQYIEQKFQRRAELMSAITGRQVTAAAAATKYNPRLILWSCTGAGSNGWYIHGTTSIFQTALKEALVTERNTKKKNPKPTSSEWWESTKWWESLVGKSGKIYLYKNLRYGWAGAKDGTSDYSKENAGKEGAQAFRNVQALGCYDNGEPGLENLAIP